MDEILPNAQSMIGMDFGWGPGTYAAPYGIPEPTNKDLSAPIGATDEPSSSFADAMSAFTYQEPADDALETTIDPMNMWPGTVPGLGPDHQSTTPSTSSSRHDSAYSSSGTPKTAQTEATAFSNPASPELAWVQTPKLPPFDEPESHPTESETTHRARYAANQRHNKARKSKQTSTDKASSSSSSSKKSDETKKQQLREKNKIAAAKCRQRQRRQAESIVAKGGRLSETNAQLKSYVQELRRELNGLRACALGHGECDERLARYNKMQAERVMKEYYSSAFGGILGGGGMAMLNDGQAEAQ